MSFYTPVLETIKIDDENSITVKAPTYGQMQDVQSKSMAVKLEMTEKGTTGGGATMDIQLMESMTIYACIHSWEGPGFEGRQPTPENIDALPVAVIETIKPAIDRLSAPMKRQQKKA